MGWNEDYESAALTDWAKGPKYLFNIALNYLIFLLFWGDFCFIATTFMKSQIKYNKFLTKQQGEKYERRSKRDAEIESTSFACMNGIGKD